MALALASDFVVDEIGRYIKTPASVQPDRPRTSYIVVHHAAAIYAPGTACAAIFKAHSTRPDFTDYHRIGYHEVIQVEIGDLLRAHLVNPPLMQGAGVYGRNDVCYHICAATNIVAIPDDGFVEALAQRVAAAKKRWPDAQIVGHKEITLTGHGTACPGQLWAAWKPRLLKRVEALLAPPPRVWTVRAGIRGAIAQQDRRPDAPTAGVYFQPGDLILVNDFTAGYYHVASEIGFVPAGQVLP